MNGLPYMSPVLAFDVTNLVPLIIVAVAVIYQIAKGIAESNRNRPSTDGGEGDASDGSVTTMSAEERLKELAERRRRQLQELAERRRKAASGGSAMQEQTRTEERRRPSPPPPPRERGRDDAPPPWEREADRRSATQAAEAAAARRRAEQDQRDAAERARSDAERERERQRRLREAARRASTQPGRRSQQAPVVRKPRGLGSPKQEVSQSAIGQRKPTEKARKKTGHAAWVRRFADADAHDLQRGIILKEILDKPLALRQGGMDGGL